MKIRFRYRATRAVAAVLSLLIALRVGADCGPPAAAAQQTCKSVQAKALPAGLRQYIAKSGCDVKPGDTYDEGYAVDLNGDGKLEYAYCCSSAAHGPCGMKLFARVAGNWTALSDEYYFSADPATPCDGVMPLLTMNSGYHDVCIGGGDTVLKFRGGKYVE